MIQSWQFDVSAAVAIFAAGAGYAWCARQVRQRGEQVAVGPAWCLGIGLGLWVLAAFSVIGIYAYVLFWVRALQVVLLLLVIPFFIAAAKPLTVLRNACTEAGRDSFDRLLRTPVAVVLAHPVTTSVSMLAAPWLLYLTPWYTATLTNAWIGALSRILLVVIGFGYFYARLQTDPVPRRYSQLISLVISIGETIGDGVLGLVLWQGPLIGVSYYSGLHRFRGPSLRLDQTIGAGVLWILGDVLGIPFILVLIRELSLDERAKERHIDAEPDDPESALWWEMDPQLQERFRRY